MWTRRDHQGCSNKWQGAILLPIVTVHGQKSDDTVFLRVLPSLEVWESGRLDIGSGCQPENRWGAL